MSQSTVTQPNVLASYTRFGLTEEEFRAALSHFEEIDPKRPKTRGNNEMPFYDWEAEKLALIFEAFAYDKDLCGLIAAMMQCVKNDFLNKRANPAKTAYR